MAHRSEWFFTTAELKRSPSLQDGMKSDDERSVREKTCGFIDQVGSKLHLPKIPIATAQTFFHRFFARQSFKKHDRLNIGVTCLFLAAKVEDVPKKLKDTINAFHIVKARNSKNGIAATELDPDSEEYWKMKETILIYERVVLQTISFDLNINHPYKPLLLMVKKVRNMKGFDAHGGTSKEFAQVAWNFVNDSMRTNLCLRYKPEVIASAAIFLASRYLKFTMPGSDGQTKSWYESLNEEFSIQVTRESIDDISRRILNLYTASQLASKKFSRLRALPSTSTRNGGTAAHTPATNALMGTTVTTAHGSNDSSSSSSSSASTAAVSKKLPRAAGAAVSTPASVPPQTSSAAGTGRKHDRQSAEAPAHLSSKRLRQ